MTKHLENLIAEIYEASANPDLWPQVMYDLGATVDAAGGIIVTRRSDGWLGWRYSAALAPGAETYMSGPVARSRSTERLVALNHAGFITEQAVFTDEEYLADSLMTDWGTPAGLHHAAATAIHIPTGDLAVFQVNRRVGEPQFDRESIRRLDSLRPHLARAGLLAARWRLERLRAAAQALAMVGLPAAILDAKGKVLAANLLLEALRQYVIWLPNDHIALLDASANALLQRAVADVADMASTSARTFPCKVSTSNPVVVHLVPASGAMRDVFDGGFAVLVITPIAVPSAPDAALLRGLFDLTHAEARVASSIAEGLSVDQIAEQHSVAIGTVRTQLKSIFGKTGVERQSQLASLLISQKKIPFHLPNKNHHAEEI